MQQSFTREFMQQNCGCYTREQLSACSFMQSETVLLSAIVNSEIPLKDKYWFICKKLATKEQNQQIAIAVAEIILPLYDAKYPNNKAVRECIDATKLFIADSISINELRTKRRAAVAAADAADAAAVDAADAAAADAAAYAAYAAYAAADAAAYAAYADAADAAATAYAAAAAADAYAAADAAYAAYAAYIKEKLLQNLLNFTNEKAAKL